MLGGYGNGVYMRLPYVLPFGLSAVRSDCLTVRPFCLRGCVVAVALTLSAFLACFSLSLVCVKARRGLFRVGLFAFVRR